MGPNFYCQLAPSMWRLWGRTAVSSQLVAMSFWRSTRWDWSQGHRSNLKTKNIRCCISVICEKETFWEQQMLPPEADAKGDVYVCIYIIIYYNNLFNYIYLYLYIYIYIFIFIFIYIYIGLYIYLFNMFLWFCWWCIKCGKIDGYSKRLVQWLVRSFCDNKYEL